MKVFNKAFLFILACFLFFSKTTFASDQAVRMSYFSVARVAIVYTKDKKDNGVTNGSGFAIDDKRIITAGHVCKEMMLEIVKGSTAKIHIIGLFQTEDVFTSEGYKIVAYDDKTDLCMLQSNDKVHHYLKPVDLAESNRLKIRDKVYTIGAPRGIFPIETEGRIMIPKQEDGKIMCSMPIYGGNSGSPLFNDNSEVIGVVVAGDKLYQNVAYSTNLEDLKKFIKKSLNKNE